MLFEIFYAFFMRIIKLLHRNLVVTIFVTVLIVLVRRKYKLIDIKREFQYIWNDLKKDRQYRKECYLIGWIMFMLFCTVFTRSFRNPFENVLGNWLPYNIQFSYVKLDCIENICLFIPYGFLLSSLRKKTFKSLVKIVSLTSLGIECYQIITLSGTFQLSDIFYNIIGGIIGILISIGIHHNK